MWACESTVPEESLDLEGVLGQGDPAAVAALITGGANLKYVREHGYNALLGAVHSRDIARDPRLLDLLSLLIANGVDLNGITTYQESGLRVLSHVGRFDAVRLLLESGAERASSRGRLSSRRSPSARSRMWTDWLAAEQSSKRQTGGRGRRGSWLS